MKKVFLLFVMFLAAAPMAAAQGPLNGKIPKFANVPTVVEIGGVQGLTAHKQLKFRKATVLLYPTCKDAFNDPSTGKFVCVSWGTTNDMSFESPYVGTEGDTNKSTSDEWFAYVKVWLVQKTGPPIPLAICQGEKKLSKRRASKGESIPGATTPANMALGDALNNAVKKTFEPQIGFSGSKCWELDAADIVTAAFPQPGKNQ